MYIDDRMEALLSVRKAKILETMARHLADPERNMMCCAVAGQGAGVAAAISVKSGTDFAEVDVGAVQQELRRQGARIA